mmetsp:Transcript_11228/g.46792  ORF Transcript_11228/g.46792 Transcript_11228/m.46792 type:complete len:238 (-) Transcript_11228:1031-1744(-)
MHVDSRRFRGQAGHGHHGPQDGHHEARARVEAQLLDGHHEAAGRTQRVGVVAERVLRLGHADREGIQPPALEALELGLRLRAQLNARCAIDLLGDGLDLGDDRGILCEERRVRPARLRVRRTRGLHRRSQFCAALATLRVHVAHHRRRRPGSTGLLKQRVDLGLVVGWEAVDRHDHWRAEARHVGHVACKVGGGTLPCGGLVKLLHDLGVRTRGLRAKRPAMELHGTDGHCDHHAVG